MRKNGFTTEEILSQSNGRLALGEIHGRLKELIYYFDQFCKANSLTYYPAGGTLIGTIRHNGFIPWDDDVDFYMPREDYKKLIKYPQITKDIDVVTRFCGDKYYHPFQHCNLSDNKTIFVSHLLRWNTGKGQYIDIFPLDNVPDNDTEKEKLMRKLYNDCRICSYSVAAKRKGGTLKDSGIRLVSSVLSHANIEGVLDRIDKTAQSYNSISCKRWGPISREARDRLVWDKDWFSSTFRHKFEDIEIDVPIGYDSILRHTFGDYMQLPPENQRGNQHEIEVYWRK